MTSGTRADAIAWPVVPGPILVTGGAGFIGSHVVDALLAGGREVRVLDSFLEAAHRERPDYLDPRAELIEGDVRDPDVVARAVEGVSAVSHQAAMVGLGVDLGDIADYVSHNDLGTAVLLRALVGLHRAVRARLEHGRLRRGPLPLHRARDRGAAAAHRPRTWTRAASSRRARAAGGR